MQFQGILPAVTTPFDSKGAVNVAALTRNVKWLLSAGSAGIVGTGTMGEASSLSASERQQVIETIAIACDGAVPVIAGVSAETPQAAAAHARAAVEVGATALMCLPPTSYAADERELVAHFATVAGAADLPIIVYNNPSASKNDLMPAVAARLAREVDQVVAIKETSGDVRRIPDLLQRTEGSLEVLVGGDDWALEGFAAGATGWISGVAVVAPELCVALYDACEGGSFDHAREIYMRLLPLAHLDMSPKLVQFFKAGMDAVGREGGPTRPPRLALSAADQTILEAALLALGHPLLTP